MTNESITQEIRKFNLYIGENQSKIVSFNDVEI